MFPSLGLTICGFIFILIITVVYYSKKRYNNFEDKVFSLEIIITIITFILEFASVFTMYNRDVFPNFNKFVCSLYVLGCEIWFSLVIIYSWGMLKTKDSNNKSTKRIIILLSLITIAGYLLFLLLPVTYTSGKNVVFYVIGGRGVLSLYIISSIALLYILYALIVNKNNVPLSKRLPIFIFLAFFISLTLIQIFTVDINDLTFLFSGFIVIMYFALENQDSKLIDELKLAKEKLEISSKEQTEFLSTISHEIRTPMNSIIGFSESLLNEKNLSNDIVKRDVGNISSAGKELLSIINNILDISRIESGKEIVEIKEYSLKKVLENTYLNYYDKISKDVSFEINVDSTMPYNLIGDESKIAKIINHLLDNSILNTDAGKIILKISYKIIDDENILFKMVVSDTGVGIKDEDYSKIFQKFVKLSDTDNSSGAGLGLVITKKLVDLMKGTISFDSVYGSGTNFYVDVVQKYGNLSKIGKIEFKKLDKKIKYFDGSKNTVLVVDDNEINLKIIERLLEPYKINVISVTSGKECIDVVKKNNNIDIILLDHMMSEMDGIETLETLKKLKIKLPLVVALTANLSPGIKDMYLSKGFNDYLGKPIDTRELNNMLIKYIFDDNKECEE